MSSDIQHEMKWMSDRISALNESIRQLVTDKRLPEYSRLMEIRATNREILDMAQKIDLIRIQLLQSRELQPLDTPEPK